MTMTSTRLGPGSRGAQSGGLIKPVSDILDFFPCLLLYDVTAHDHSKPFKSLLHDKGSFGLSYCHGLAGRSPFLESPGNFRARGQILQSKPVQ